MANLGGSVRTCVGVFGSCAPLSFGLEVRNKLQMNIVNNTAYNCFSSKITLSWMDNKVMARHWLSLCTENGRGLQSSMAQASTYCGQLSDYRSQMASCG